MRIAYLINRYPAISHSFIRREIAAIEADGHEVQRHTIRPYSNDLPDLLDQAEAARTQVLLARSPILLLVDALTIALTRPTVTLSALCCALKMARPGIKSKLLHLVYLVEAASLARWFTKHPVDHLHAHFGTNPAAVARLIRMLGGPRYSFTVHGPDEFDDPRGLSLAGKIADADAAVAISSFGRSQLMRWSNPVHWPRIIVARCGVDEGFLYEQEDNAPPNGNEFCCIARLSGQKGLPLLIEACGLLKHRGVDFHLRVLGDGELRGLIEQRIRALGLAGHVTLEGNCDGATVRRHLLASRAFVLPSFAEGLPVVIMEALALQRPVIVTAIAGTPELVDADCGWLIPAGSSDAIAHAMEEALATEPAKLAKMGAEGRRRVLERHDARRNGPGLVAEILRLRGSNEK